MDRRDFLKKAGAATLLLSAGKVLSAAETVEDSVTPDGNVAEKKRRVPVSRTADVGVCGGGPAGIGAAVEAARSGARVVLVEHAGFLGGTWTAGLLGVMLDHENKTGLMQELKQTLTERKWRNTKVWTDELFTFDVERMKLLLDELCAEHKIEVLLYTSVVAAVVDRGRITHVVTESKSGREAIAGEIFIDATGDGDVAALSGCGFDWGDADGHVQPMSMLGLVTGARFEEIEDCVLWNGRKTRRASKRNLIAEIRRGGFEASYKMPCLFLLHDDLYALMATHQYGAKSISRDDLTRASIEAEARGHGVADRMPRRPAHSRALHGYGAGSGRRTPPRRRCLRGALRSRCPFGASRKRGQGRLLYARHQVEALRHSAAGPDRPGCQGADDGGPLH